MQHEAFSRRCRRLIFSFLRRGHVCQKKVSFYFYFSIFPDFRPRPSGRWSYQSSTFAIIAIYHGESWHGGGGGGLFGPAKTSILSSESPASFVACVRSVRTCCWCRRSDDSRRQSRRPEGSGRRISRRMRSCCPLTSTPTNHKIMRSSSLDTFSSYFPSYAKNNCENQFRLSGASWVTSKACQVHSEKTLKDYNKLFNTDTSCGTEYHGILVRFFLCISWACW